MTDIEPTASDAHPTPGSPQASRVRTFVSLFGAAGAWLIQMTISEPLAAHACYPNQVALTAPLWSTLPLMLVIINIVCLTAALVSGFVALSTWRRSRWDSRGDGKSATDAGHAQFLPIMGVIASQIFVVAILFTSCAVVLVAPCSPWF